jgi:hypothetical protein
VFGQLIRCAAAPSFEPQHPAFVASLKPKTSTAVAEAIPACRAELDYPIGSGPYHALLLNELERLKRQLADAQRECKRER